MGMHCSGVARGGARVLEHPPCGDFNVYGRGWSSAFTVMHAHAGARLPTSMDSCTVLCKRWPALAYIEALRNSAYCSAVQANYPRCFSSGD